MPPSQKQTRPPLRRMVTIHRELAAGAFPNCTKLAALLEVSPKTVQRDLEFMRDQLELPVEYHSARFGYFYSESVSQFPGMEVSEGEIIALLVAQKAMAQYRGTTYEKPLAAAFRKMTDGLQDKISFAWEEVDSGVSFRSLGQSVSDLELFERVSKSVLRSEEIAFEYRKLKGENYENREVQPYHLGCVEQQWYLFGWDLERQQMRTFALPRMRKVKRTKRKFLRPATFSIADYLAGSFGVFSGNGEQSVVLEFDAFAARLVAERQWHESQSIDETAEGLRLSLRLSSLEEVERWVLSWGAHVRVIEPAALVEKIAAAAGQMVRLYADEGRAAEI